MPLLSPWMRRTRLPSDLVLYEVQKMERGPGEVWGRYSVIDDRSGEEIGEILKFAKRSGWWATYIPKARSVTGIDSYRRFPSVKAAAAWIVKQETGPRWL